MNNHLSENIIGNKYGKLSVLSASKNKQYVNCICECGNKKEIKAKELIRGAQKSCGCSKYKWREKISAHPLYSTWKGMRERCNRPKSASYANYGAKGVKVCKEWQESFPAFRDWCLNNGWQPGLQIDKDIIPKKIGIPALLYSPEMCTITTQVENTYIRSSAKLTKQQVREIRNSNINWKDACEKYKIDNTTFYDIRNNKIWVNV